MDGLDAYFMGEHYLCSESNIMNVWKVPEGSEKGRKEKSYGCGTVISPSDLLRKFTTTSHRSGSEAADPTDLQRVVRIINDQFHRIFNYRKFDMSRMLPRYAQVGGRVCTSYNCTFHLISSCDMTLVPT